MIRAIMFDHDGVLVDSMPYHVEAWKRVMARRGIELDPLEIYLAEGATTMEVAAELFHRHGKPASPDQVQEIVREKRDEYLKNNATQLSPGIMEVLTYLKENRYRLGLVTGSIRAQVEPVIGPEIRDWFDCIITAEDVECGKPDPEPYLRAMQKLHVAPSETLVIENAPLGIRSAKSAGAAVVAITTTLAPHHLREADVIVHDFVELRRRLPSIMSKYEAPALQPKPQPVRPEFQRLIDIEEELY
ncbi:MAG: HAD family phosphatase [candidate division KSB1 bacterium]|nr:HAD family phosphatase [candidate division KSB1 bacterium]MDZ7301748.1 HAD family phosphatase [candidate division KSB1 bacterium]MDZ7311473.1 HAD family phosphatase [candidate division KSB1 bacterium]